MFIVRGESILVCNQVGIMFIVTGESILVCKPSERNAATILVTSQLPAVSSCLFRNASEGLSSSMKRAILEVIFFLTVLTSLERITT